MVLRNTALSALPALAVQLAKKTTTNVRLINDQRMDGRTEGRLDAAQTQQQQQQQQQQQRCQRLYWIPLARARTVTVIDAPLPI